jgi:curved DNA-binding protein CbpA
VEADLNAADVLDAAERGSYFECLGLRPDAATREVRDAYPRVVACLEGARAAGAGAPEVIDDALAIVRDAFAVLSDPDLRLAYRRAIEAGRERG